MNETSMRQGEASGGELGDDFSDYSMWTCIWPIGTTKTLNYGERERPCPEICGGEWRRHLATVAATGTRGKKRRSGEEYSGRLEAEMDQQWRGGTNECGCGESIRWGGDWRCGVRMRRLDG